MKQTMAVLGIDATKAEFPNLPAVNSLQIEVSYPPL